MPLTLPETNTAPEKWAITKGKFIFRLPTIDFAGPFAVSFREGMQFHLENLALEVQKQYLDLLDM